MSQSYPMSKEQEARFRATIEQDVRSVLEAHESHCLDNLTERETVTVKIADRVLCSLVGRRKYESDSRRSCNCIPGSPLHQCPVHSTKVAQ